ncbi:uncharacterized protein LOC109858535 [Pseudomyrmex gracilis]|uniref:uncharacterized protein LOC109858535 n=1 Tax=Pseudomyrmex gracilis TaxID=219809 RepID=UPI000995DD7C|nr:uncharacterized protein LOC109858535 [Pseudomyrmex gracilis]
MALNMIKQIRMLGQRLLIPKASQSAKVYTGSLFEPDYLQTGKSKIPLVSTLNVQIKGYNYPELESYQSFIHKIADIMQIDIDDSWPLPPETFKIQRFKMGTAAIAAEYNLKVYERNVQISDVPSTKCSVLVRVLEAALPQGVILNVDIFDPEYEKKRYVPDKELLDLQSTLDTMKNKKS